MVRFRAAPGLHAVTVLGDASRFNWEELYLNLNRFGNVNERTGPWDFDLTANNRPVIPAYWVWLDGRRLGLWYFNRPSSRQIAERRFQGELNILVRDGGERHLHFEPYRSFSLDWIEARVEPEPHDRWELADPIARDLLGELLPPEMPENRFTDGFLASVDWAMTQVEAGKNSGHHLPVLCAAWRWRSSELLLGAARKVIEAFLAKPTWGNAREDGYGHNGDMGAAIPLFGLATALRWLGPALGDLRKPLFDRLRHQGNLFLEMAFLHRGYWGGSILQDHGFTSMAYFASAAYVLQDLLPDAREWLGFARHRMERTLDAMPRDGIVPSSSYHDIWMYADRLALYRELHLRATGEDIHRRPAIRAIPAATKARYEPETGQLAFPSPRGDTGRLDGGHSFLAQLEGDPDARWLLDRFFEDANLRRKRASHPESHFQKDWLWALLFVRGTLKDNAEPFSSPEVQVMRSGTGLEVRSFMDSNVGVARGGGGCLIATANSLGAVANRPQVRCCCDRAVFAPLAGNFVYFHRGRKVLHTAEGGYRMTSLLGNVLLVNGASQKGDIGMPMSYPDFEDHGEHLASLAGDGSGFTMDLTGAYEGVRDYMRFLGLDPKGHLHLRDEVTLERPGTLRWLLQSYRHNPWHRESSLEWSLTVDGQRYRVRFQLEGMECTSRLAPTKIVWGYVNNNGDEPCHHLEIETERPVVNASLQLVVEELR